MRNTCRLTRLILGRQGKPQATPPSRTRATENTNQCRFFDATGFWNLSRADASLHASSIDIKVLQQNFNDALTSTDPALVDAAWQAINAARAGTETVRAQAVAAIATTQHQAGQSIQKQQRQQQLHQAALRQKTKRVVLQAETAARQAPADIRTEAQNAVQIAHQQAQQQVLAERHNAAQQNTVVEQGIVFLLQELDQPHQQLNRPAMPSPTNPAQGSSPDNNSGDERNSTDS